MFISGRAPSGCAAIRHDRLGERAGYHNEGDVRLEERLQKKRGDFCLTFSLLKTIFNKSQTISRRESKDPLLELTRTQAAFGWTTRRFRSGENLKGRSPRSPNWLPRDDMLNDPPWNYNQDAQPLRCARGSLAWESPYPESRTTSTSARGLAVYRTCPYLTRR